MSIYEMLLFGISLSMDAFAVAICKGLAMKKATLKNCIIVGLWFGFFQALMPFIGYMVGSTFSQYIEKFDYIFAFILLFLIGANMIKESFSKDDQNNTGGSLAFRIMLIMAIATSIDALIVGVAFSCGEQLTFIRMLIAISIIGVTTFLLSMLGTKIGNIFGSKYKSRAEFFGGAILILLGLKSLVEGLGVINL